MNQPATAPPPAEIVPVRPAHIEVPIDADGRFAPTNLSGLYELSRMIADSKLAPKDMKDTSSICVVMAKGLEIGLSPLSALQSIALINGRPAIFGDAALAIILSSKACEYLIEREVGHPPEVADNGVMLNIDPFWGYECVTKRRGGVEEVMRHFNVSDARLAKLWGKSGPWSQYPRRMLQMRARAFLLRDVYPDILSGIRLVEEEQDIDEPRAVPVRVLDPRPQTKKVTPAIRAQTQEILDATAKHGPAPDPDDGAPDDGISKF